VIPFKSHGDDDVVLAAWTLPLIVAAIAVAIVGGFYLGGPGLGLAVGALAASTVIVLAGRADPRGPIVPAPLHDLRRHILLVSRAPLEDPRAVAEIADICAGQDPLSPASEVRLLVPRTRGRLDRWSGERRPAFEAAQRRCVLSLAALGKAGLAARADVGDEDVVLAIEDELRTYPATDVILVSAGDERDEAARVADELRERLQADFLHLEPAVGSAAALPKERGRRFTR
jgi:hypothetical protein